MTNDDTWPSLADACAVLGIDLRFPAAAPNGDPVIFDDVRLHARARSTDDVYFEISRHAWLSVAQVYEREKRGIEAAGHRRITRLESTTMFGRQAWHYRLEWADGERAVVLVEHNGYVYRILHNSRAELSRKVIDSIEFK